jgi:hypothetical protein
LDLFEFIIGMISVILALAVSQLFLGAADLVRHRVRVRFFLGHSIWLINLFLLAFLHWWSIWAFRDLSWNFGMFFFSLIGPSLMFFAAAVLNPRDFPEQGVDLAHYFLSIRRFFFGVLILMLLLFTVDGPFFGTEPALNSARLVQIAVGTVVTWGLVSDRRNSHTAISLTTLVILCALVIIRFFPR